MKHAVSLEREKKMWIMIAYTTFELQLIIVSIYIYVWLRIRVFVIAGWNWTTVLCICLTADSRSRHFHAKRLCVNLWTIIMSLSPTLTNLALGPPPDPFFLKKNLSNLPRVTEYITVNIFKGTTGGKMLAPICFFFMRGRRCCIQCVLLDLQ